MHSTDTAQTAELSSPSPSSSPSLFVTSRTLSYFLDLFDPFAHAADVAVGLEEPNDACLAPLAEACSLHAVAK